MSQEIWIKSYENEHENKHENENENENEKAYSTNSWKSQWIAWNKMRYK